MKRKFIAHIAPVIILILCFVACAHEARSEECLSYEPAKITLYGTIVEKTFPGPPEFESIEKGDRPDTHWVLKLKKPVCVNGDHSDELNSETEEGVKNIQLILDAKKYARYRPLVSQKVFAEGTLFHAHTGYHRTKVLMEVISIKPAKSEGKK